MNAVPKSRIRGAERGGTRLSAEPIVRLEGVRKSFGDNLVLDGIDVTVAPGEVLTIIGLERQR